MKLTQQQTEDVITVAKEAGKATLPFYKSQSVEVEKKEDNSPLTKADIASHNVIYPALKKITPDIPVVSEEGEEKDDPDRTNWQTLWMVDPLDGTKEFIKKGPDYTVNIALIENGQPTFGVVYAPATEKLYFGSKELGSFTIKDNKKAKLKSRIWISVRRIISKLLSVNHIEHPKLMIFLKNIRILRQFLSARL